MGLRGGDESLHCDGRWQSGADLNGSEGEEFQLCVNTRYFQETARDLNNGGARDVHLPPAQCGGCQEGAVCRCLSVSAVRVHRKRAALLNESILRNGCSECFCVCTCLC